jgi:hypothetical protein
MEPSSRTPEGEPNRCPVCGNATQIEPSSGSRDAPCPSCGSLLWFRLTQEGARPPSKEPGRLSAVYATAVNAASRSNHDYANVLLKQCVADDPFNPIYVRSYTENLRKKHKNDRKGAPMAEFKTRSARNALRAAEQQQDWEGVVKNGLIVLEQNPWDVLILRKLAAASKTAGSRDCEMYFLDCVLRCDPQNRQANADLAQALAERGLIDQARVFWQRAERGSPGSGQEGG